MGIVQTIGNDTIQVDHDQRTICPEVIVIENSLDRSGLCGCYGGFGGHLYGRSGSSIVIYPVYEFTLCIYTSPIFYLFIIYTLYIDEHDDLFTLLHIGYIDTCDIATDLSIESSHSDSLLSSATPNEFFDFMSPLLIWTVTMPLCPARRAVQIILAAVTYQHSVL